VATDSVFRFRCSSEEVELWRGAAHREDSSLSSWARRALNDQAALDAALERETLSEPGKAEGRVAPVSQNAPGSESVIGLLGRPPVEGKRTERPGVADAPPPGPVSNVFRKRFG
jgi:hypothetical protein